MSQDNQYPFFSWQAGLVMVAFAETGCIIGFVVGFLIGRAL